MVCRQHSITELKCLGGFKNDRTVFGWSGQTIELDETLYEWGTVYEIELETVRFWSYILADSRFVCSLLIKNALRASMYLKQSVGTNRTSRRRFNRNWRIS